MTTIIGVIIIIIATFNIIAWVARVPRAGQGLSDTYAPTTNNNSSDSTNTNSDNNNNSNSKKITIIIIVIITIVI